MTDGEYMAALILCGGRSSRIGVFKPLLSLGQETIIERIIGLFRNAGIAEILVVLGHDAELLKPVLERHGVRYVINDGYDEGMFSSVKAGVNNIDRQRRAFFLLPADIPLVRPETLHSLMRSFEEKCADVCRPCYRGKRGHPPLISSALILPIMDFKGHGGLRMFLSRYKERTIDVDCDDPGILMDIDTPEDYEKVLKALEC